MGAEVVAGVADAGAGKPNLNVEVEEAAGLAAAFVAPGRGVSQALHWSSLAVLRTMHTSHSHWPALFLNLSPRPANPDAVRGAAAAVSAGAGATAGVGAGAGAAGLIVSAVGATDGGLRKTSMTLPVFSWGAAFKGGVSVSASVALTSAAVANSGELKLNAGGLAVTAAAAADGLTVTSGAAKVNVGRTPLTALTLTGVESNTGGGGRLAAKGLLTCGGADGAAEEDVGGGGRRLKLGKCESGSETAGSSGSASSSLSLAKRSESLGGAVSRARIFPPTWPPLIGVLAARTAGAAEVVVVTVGAAAEVAAVDVRFKTAAGRLTDNLAVGGPRCGRRRLNPKPVRYTY